MIDLATIGIKADTRDLNRGRKDVDKFANNAARADKATGRFTTGISGMSTAAKAAGGALAALGLGRVVKGIYNTNVESQRLKASLITVTGSIDNANTAWAKLEEFASTTPYELEQSITAFTRMKSLGLNPTREALTSFGNTAASMGKDLNQMIEAVADASTGEFERLKEFGIRAKQQKESVAFTFQGVTTEVKKNSEEITAYLRSIGDTAFAGAMERQMATLGGAASNLGDNMGALARAVGQAGANEGFAAAIGFASTKVAEITEFIREGGNEFVSLSEILNVTKESAKALAIIMGGRLVAAAASSTAAFLGATTQVLAYQVAVAKAAGASTAAAAGMGVLAGASRVLAGALALVGGPLGAAVIGVTALFVYRDELKSTADTFIESNPHIQNLKRAWDDLTDSVEDSTEALRKHERYAGPYADYWDRIAGQTVQTTPLIYRSAEALETQAESAKKSTGALQELGDTSESSGEKACEAVSKASEETEKLVETTDAAQKSFERGIERFRDIVGDYFRTMLVDGKLSMGSLVDSFKAMIAEMVATAAANRIMVSMGMMSASAASQAGGMLGSGGFSPSGIMSGIGNFGAGTMNMVGEGAAYLGHIGVPGMDSLSTSAFQQGMTMTPGTALAGAGAGLVGGFASNAVFGETSGIGNTLGGTLGMAIGGPLGAGIGSFLGGGIESLFGGDNNGDNPGRAQINLGTGASSIGGVGKTFDEANVDQVQQAADFAKRVAAVVGGSSAALDITAGNDGLRVGGRNFGQDASAFLDRIFDNVVNQAGDLSQSLKRLITGFEGTSEEALQFAGAITGLERQIKENPVELALADFMSAQEQASGGLIGTYRRQIESISNLASEFDGSLSATQKLNGALSQNQKLAYELAAAVLQVSNNIQQMTERTAAQFREAAMSEDERMATWRARRNELTRSLTDLSDPEKIQSTTAEINRLSQAMFDALSPEAQVNRAEAFATYTERINEIAQNRLDKSLESIQASQESQNERLNDMLQKAANTQLESAQRFDDAVSRFEAAAERRDEVSV